MAEDLEALFRPRSVAIVGASNQPQKWGHIVMKNVLEGGFEGPVFPVNPKGGEVLGRAAYTSVRDIPEQVDLAFVGVAAKHIPAVVEDCGEAGCQVAVIVTSGFGEMGAEGREQQGRIVEAARAANLRIVGPNCMGVYTAGTRLYASIGLDPIRPGRVALISQSGNVGVALFRLGIELGLGFHSFIGVGNQADVGFHEYVEYLTDDPECDVIALYLEGLQDGPAFFRAVRRCAPSKPVIVLKGGRSRRGGQATRSHTGALATDARMFQGLLQQAGGVLATSLEELIAYTQVLSAVPRRRSGRVGILTDGGGFGVIATDSCEELGLELARPTSETKERLRSQLPPYCSTENPVDIGGDADSDPSLFATSLEIFLKDPGVDAMLVTGIFGGYRDVFAEELAPPELGAGERIPDIVREAGKPTVVQSLWARADAPALRAIRDGGVPVLESLDLSIRGLAALDGYVRAVARLREAPARPRPTSAREPGPNGSLTETEAYELLATHGVEVPPFAVVESAEEAIDAGRRFGYPVVVKMLSRMAAHKSEVGGVILDVHGDEAVADAFRKVARDSQQVLVSRQISSGLEVIVGVVNDPSFGHVVLVGLGGLYVEAFGDVVFRAIPITEADVHDMLRQNRRLSRALGAARRGRPLQREALVRLILSIGRFAEDNPSLREVDLNPVIVTETQACVVDAKVKFAG